MKIKLMFEGTKATSRIDDDSIGNFNLKREISE